MKIFLKATLRDMILKKGDDYNTRVMEEFFARSSKSLGGAFNGTASIIGSLATWDFVLSSFKDIGSVVKSLTSSLGIELSLLKQLTLGSEEIAKALGSTVSKAGMKAFAAEGVPGFLWEGINKSVQNVPGGATREYARQQAAFASNAAYQSTLAAKAAAEVAEEVAEETAKQAAKKAAEKASEQAVKTMGRITGGVTVGLGGLFTAWDGYNMFKGWKKTNTSSPLGDELRKLEKVLLNHLNGPQ